MTGLATFIQASAHSLPMLADGSVQMVATSYLPLIGGPL